MSYKVDQLMKSEMSRAQFLKVMGLGVLSLFGLSAIWRVLDYQGNDSTKPAAEDTYGGQAYGGVEIQPTTKTFG